MSYPRILALVLAGGEGRRLRPLTAERPKPAVELGRGCRIVDFALANLANSGVPWIYLLAQYKPAPLIEHVARVWRPLLAARGCMLRPVLPAGTGGEFRGTADAVYRNLHLLARHDPDIVAVFAADHVYRMDVRQMAQFHMRRCADLTVAAMPVPLGQASSFGVIEARADGRIESFQEKPAQPPCMPDDPHRAYVSMGNYLFDPAALVELLEAVVGRGATDFGHDVLPYAVRNRARVYAYDFATNRVPGLKAHEEAAYWRDVGTLEALAEARRDIEGPQPRLELDNPQWPLRPRADEPETKLDVPMRAELGEAKLTRAQAGSPPS
jgi:glucose-1-phosphate adenylyltransferase